MRRWLLAYPPRWRWQRAEEVVGTLADLGAAGATRLDVRSGLELVVHGLATRRRMRPPLRWTLRFGLLNTALPWQYRGWVADRIASPWFQGGSFVALATILLANAALRLTGGPGELAWWGAYGLALIAMPRTRARRQAAARHLVARPQDPPTPWDLRPAWVYQERLGASSTVPTLAAAAAALTLVAAVATVVTGSGRGPAVAACGAVGTLGAARLLARWRRVVAARPPQPARRLAAAGRHWRVSVGCWSVAAFLTCVTGPGSSAGTTVAPLVLGALLLVLPALVVAAALTRRGPTDLAMLDVWRLLAGRGPLPVDAVQRGYVPAWQAPPAPGAVPLMGGPPALPPTPGTAGG